MMSSCVPLISVATSPCSVPTTRSSWWRWPSTILPAFAASLGAPNVVIGAIPAVMTAGWFLPPLFVAAYTEVLARKLPFMLRWTLWERVPFFVLAAAAYWLADRAPALTLGLLLAM